MAPPLVNICEDCVLGTHGLVIARHLLAILRSLTTTADNTVILVERLEVLQMLFEAQRKEAKLPSLQVCYAKTKVQVLEGFLCQSVRTTRECDKEVNIL